MKIQQHGEAEAMSSKKEFYFLASLLCVDRFELIIDLDLMLYTS